MTRAQELELDQNLSFQRREWLTQRIGWWILSAFVGAAALGLFGGGPLSTGRARAPEGALRIEYERFVRVGAPTRLLLHTTGTASESDIHIRITRSYFETLRVGRIVPEPRAVAIGEEDVALTFDSAGSAPGPFTVILDVEPLRAGRHTAAFRLNGEAPLTFVQLAYF